MAIDSTTAEWDEEAINELYRAWQRNRDGVNNRYYQPILEAAREMNATSAEEQLAMESGMDRIRAAARAQFLDQRLPDPDAVAAVPGRSVSESVDRLKTSMVDAIAGFIDSISPRQWVPVAVTAALVVAVAPFVLDTDPMGSMQRNIVAQSETLSTKGGLVESELDRLGDFQLGFASSASEYASAFNAGVVFSNLVALGDQPAVGQRARSMETLARLTGVSPDSSIAVAELGDELQRYYSDDSYAAVFVFGQWVETGYLLSRAGLQNPEDASILEALISLLSDRPNVVALLQQADHYAPRLSADLDQLEMAVSDDALDAAELRRVSTLLLKIRTVETRM